MAAAIQGVGWRKLARKWNQTSVLGAFLDLTADKLLVTGTLAALLVVDRVNIWLAFIIIGREIAIMALRGGVASDGDHVPASRGGKWKATVQFIALGDEWGPLFLDEWVMIGAVVITVVSAADYIVRYRSALFARG